MIANTPAQESEYLPARMVNEFVYCPRLFFYEQVEGIFVHNQETIEGAINHARVDREPQNVPSPEELLERPVTATARSLTLGSDRLGVIAKLDLLECSDGCVTPVDYKRGRPCSEPDGSIGAWPTDRVQLAIAALILRDHGYRCEEAIVFYATTRQRVRLTIDAELERWTLEMIAAARATAAEGKIPAPLVNDPRCPRCSLVGVCLPDETHLLQIEPPADHPPAAGRPDEPPDDIRRLIPARDDLRSLYLNTHGLYVGIKGEVLTVKNRDTVLQEVRLNEISQLNLLGNIQLTTQAIQALCQADKPIVYFSGGGWFYGLTRGLGLTNVFLRRDQFRRADDPEFCLSFSRSLVAGKIRNQRTLLMRNHIEPPRSALALLRCLQHDAERAASMESLLGIEGNAARVYFEHFSGMIKIDRRAGEGGELDVSQARELDDEGSSDVEADEEEARSASDGASESERAAPQEERETAGNGAAWSFDFDGRNRRPPRDPVNALLSLAYSVLAKDCTIAAHAIGFDPYVGFYHQPRYGRPALALDLMEPFRPLIADSCVLTAINTRMIGLGDFIRAGESVLLSQGGRKKFFHVYEQRMDSLVTHPIFGYRISYRRTLEVQSRLLARYIDRQIREYPVFTTR